MMLMVIELFHYYIVFEEIPGEVNIHSNETSSNYSILFFKSSISLRSAPLGDHWLVLSSFLIPLCSQTAWMLINRNQEKTAV